MRKIILSMLLSLDGFFEDQDKAIDWHVIDDETNQHIIDLLNNIDTVLLGRLTYQIFENFWPDAAKNPSISTADLIVAEKLNNTTKIVFSRTLKKVEWKNAELVTEVIPQEIMKMKQQSGKDIVMFGGADLAQSFMQHGLIDEYWFIVSPVALGKGKSLFGNLHDRLALKLLKTKKTSSGNIILYYQPKTANS